MRSQDDMFRDLAEIAAAVTGRSLDEILREAEQKQRQRRARVIRKNARFAATVKSATSEKSEALVRDGYRIVRTFTSRRTGDTALMLQKDKVYNPAKGRVGVALAMVYPDGSVVKTMEKRISLKQDF